MSFDWTEYLFAARVLIAKPTTEAVYRIAISRAYYAAFCKCRNFARDKNELIPRGDAGDHNFIIDHFQKSSERDRRRIGNFLDRLRRDRNVCDYVDDNLEDASQLAQDSVRKASEILKLLKQL